MTGPAYELPDTGPPPSSTRWGWISFWAIVAFLALNQLGGYLARPPSDLVVDASLDLELRSALLEKEAARRLTALAPAVAPKNKEKEKTPASGFESVLKEVAKLRKTNADAALVYAAIQTELGKPFTPEDIAGLIKSKDSSFQAAAKVYLSKSLTIAEARALAKKLDGPNVAWKLARIHAFEKAGDKSVRRREIPDWKLGLFLVMGVVIVVAVVLGGAVLLIFAAQNKAKRIRPLGFPSGQLSAQDADRFAARAAQLLALFIGGNIVIGIVFGERGDDAAKEALLGAVLLVLGLLFYRVPVGGRIISLSEIGLNGDRILAKALYGIAGALANAPLLIVATGIMLLLQKVMPQAEHPLSHQIAEGADPIRALYFLLAAAVFAPFFEELCFRGTLLPALASVLGKPVWGIVVSSVVFAIIHPTGVPAWPGLAVIGATAAVLTYFTRSLVPAIVMHSVHNGALVLFSVALY